MSYILDALRKADAERERDPTRGIHAQPLAALPAQEQRSSSLKGAWLTAGVVLAAWAAYGFWSRESAAPATAIVPVPVIATPSPVAAPPSPVAANVVMPPAPPTVVRVVAPVAAPARPASAPLVATPPTPPTPTAPVEQPASRLYALAELPADVQRELPKFAISGGVHSENIAQRMLVVGGQVLNEGSEVAPGVVLEQIRARTAVLRFRNYRFSVGY